MNLEDRVAREKEAYDVNGVFEKSRKLQERFWHVFYCPNSVLMDETFEAEIKTNSKGKTVLDYGCFNGDFVNEHIAIYKPKKVVGIDISEKAIKVAVKRYSKVGTFYVMDAHKTTFEDNTFDFIVGRSILHHLEWGVAIKEIHRILKPGGVAIFTEPLNINPFAKFLRLLTKDTRTHDEAALLRKQIVQANKIIGTPHHSFYGLTSVPVAMLTTYLFKDADNILLRITDRIDRVLLKTPIKYWARQSILKWEKE